MKQITDSEMIIMKIIWRAKGMVTSGYVQEHLPADVTWKTTTVTTFLSRKRAGYFFPYSVNMHPCTVQPKRLPDCRASGILPYEKVHKPGQGA